MKILTINIIFSILILITTSFSSRTYTEEIQKEGKDLTMVLSQKSPTASDKLDGEVTITVKGGKAPYTLVIHTNTRSNSQELKGESFELKNLPKGFYMFNLTDAEGNFASQNINL